MAKGFVAGYDQHRIVLNADNHFNIIDRNDQVDIEVRLWDTAAEELWNKK
jgi:hypothetical protein